MVSCSIVLRPRLIHDTDESMYASYVYVALDKGVTCSFTGPDSMPTTVRQGQQAVALLMVPSCSSSVIIRNLPCAATVQWYLYMLLYHFYAQAELVGTFSKLYCTRIQYKLTLIELRRASTAYCKHTPWPSMLCPLFTMHSTHLSQCSAHICQIYLRTRPKKTCGQQNLMQHSRSTAFPRALFSVLAMSCREICSLSICVKFKSFLSCPDSRRKGSSMCLLHKEAIACSRKLSAILPIYTHLHASQLWLR